MPTANTRPTEAAIIRSSRNRRTRFGGVYPSLFEIGRHGIHALSQLLTGFRPRRAAIAERQNFGAFVIAAHAEFDALIGRDEVGFDGFLQLLVDRGAFRIGGQLDHDVGILEGFGLGGFVMLLEPLHEFRVLGHDQVFLLDGRIVYRRLHLLRRRAP